ncbi:pyridoxal-phosphate-dependent aminotransferase family protein [Methanoplanus endosymbiosus]|uniref:Alanine--glyoxylate aminotransferase family protein n=1 Tax=Methanoplanus endosymbiosus TaxID=33865 RepID=A0A9E7PRJ0_9EURY|nr:alanine--glyoxylate aminotransferase family protein [Methanoplanus endosymbiosus]UUX93776.1 alanine--glyoxylate aminotransferase family protein [Methanoplanus endosymbiosus]
MQDETLLMMPGPVPMPQRVRMAMARQSINHRGAEFAECLKDLNRMLKPMFGTENDIMVISGSGTAAMEASVANFCAGKKVSSLVNGKFGDRLFKISEIYAEEATELKSDWGTPLPLEELEKALEEGTEAVTLVHNETSAAIKNPAEEVGRLCRKHDALFIMDGITSIAGDEVLADKWGADVTVVGSQKCLAAPAGLSAVSASEKAWENLAEKRPFYLDLAAYKKSAAKDQTPFTPAVPLFFAMREACSIIEEEGLEKRIARHRNMAEAVRAAAQAWGLELFAKPDKFHSYSNTATAISYPDGISDSDFRGAVKKYGIEISGGQDHIKGKIFRIGTMGATGIPEVLSVIAAAEKALRELGYKVESSGTEAAADVLKI